MLGCFPCCGLKDPILGRWLQVGGGIGNAEWRRALEHEDRAGHEEGKTERGRSRQALVEREADEQNRHLSISRLSPLHYTTFGLTPTVVGGGGSMAMRRKHGDKDKEQGRSSKE